MKTIEEYLNELPQPYKQQALINMEAEEATSLEKDLKDALQFAFVWKESPEGFDYWDNLYISL